MFLSVGSGDCTPSHALLIAEHLACSLVRSSIYPFQRYFPVLAAERPRMSLNEQAVTR